MVRKIGGLKSENVPVSKYGICDIQLPSPTTTLRPWHLFCSSWMHETYSEVSIGKDIFDHF